MEGWPEGCPLGWPVGPVGCGVGSGVGFAIVSSCILLSANKSRRSCRNTIKDRMSWPVKEEAGPVAMKSS